MSEAVTDDEGGAAAADHRQANLAAAFQLAAAGLPILPVKMVKNGVGEWDKPPLVRDWQRVATTDPAQIEHWWDEFPDAVPGIELGRARLVVVDADRHGETDGVEAMRKLVGDHRNLPDGPRTKTAGEGLHLIFKQPDDVQLGNGEGSLPDGINIRGAGGYVVGPGAVRPDRARYRPADDAADLAEAFATGTIPAVPDWVVDIIGKDGGKNADGPTNNSDLPGDRERAFAAAALAKSIAEIEQAGRGTRNNMLNSVAYRLGRMIARGWIEELAVVDGLSQACHSNGLVNDDGLGSVRSTIESGLSAGRSHPHSDLQDRAISQAESPAAPNVESPPLIPVVWDGEAKHNPTKWMVRDLIPMDAIGLIVGEAGSGRHLPHEGGQKGRDTVCCGRSRRDDTRATGSGSSWSPRSVSGRARAIQKRRS
jgi:hypothetical protein